MKKSLILTVGAAALLAVSCGGGNKPAKGWSSEVKKLFKDHFSGNVLPYFDASALGLGELAFSWDDEQEMVVVEGGEITQAKTLYDLADKLEALGFVDLDAEDEGEDRSLRSARRSVGSRDVDPTWPAEGIAEWLWDDITDTVPEFVYDGIVDIYLDDGYTGALYVDITLAEGADVEDAIASYEDILLDAGYFFEYTDSWGDSYYLSPNLQLEVGAYEYGDGIEIYISRAPVPEFNYYLELDNKGQKSFFFVYFTSIGIFNDEDEEYMEPSIPGNFLMYVYDPYYYEFPTDEIAAVYEAFGLDLTLPSIDAAYYSFYGDDYNELYIMFDMPEYINFTVVAYEIGGENAASAYVSKLARDGWEELEGYDGYFVLEYEGEGFSVDMYLELAYYADYDALAVTFYPYADIPVPVVAEWPAEDIAEDFAGLGYTDAMPEFTGEYISATYVATYHQIQIVVEEGSEAAGVAQYQKDLGDALFKENGADMQGNKIFYSPNEQYQVIVWDGSAYGYDGYVVVDIEAIPEPVLPGFINREALAHLESCGATGVTLPDFSSLEDKVLDHYVSGISYIVFLEGDCVEAVLALLTGYSIPETPNPQWGYECVSSDSVVEIDVFYNSTSDYTRINFYYYPDLL